MTTELLSAGPYKGLVPYSEEDAPFFFGREADRDVVIANLLGSHLTLLYGASGVGKSSLLYAGIVDHLRRLARQELEEQGAPELALATFSTWQGDPLPGLLQALQTGMQQAFPGRELEPVPRSLGLIGALRTWTQRLDGNLLVLLDQFEEYFLYHPRVWDEEMRLGSRSLRRNTLHTLGGAQRIVQTHLDATLAALSAAEREVAARVFRYLVTPRGAKVALAVEDLSAYTDLPPERVTAVLEKLALRDVRILRQVANQPETAGYEIFHDVLAAPILDWRQRFESTKAQAKAKEELRRRTSRLRLGIVGLALLLAAMGALTFWVFRQRQQAVQAKQRAQDIAVVMAGEWLAKDPTRAALVLLDVTKPGETAYSVARLQEAVTAPLSEAVLRGHEGRVRSATFSPDGRRVVTASDDRTARVWAADGSREPVVLGGHQGSVMRAAFSPDGRRIVTASEDGTARVWAADGSGEPVVLRGHEDSVLSAAFSLDGRRIVTASEDGTARVWAAGLRRARGPPWPRGLGVERRLQPRR